MPFPTLNDLLTGIAKVALCEFGTPFSKPMVQTAIESVAAWAAGHANGEDK